MGTRLSDGRGRVRHASIDQPAWQGDDIAIDRKSLMEGMLELAERGSFTVLPRSPIRTANDSSGSGKLQHHFGDQVPGFEYERQIQPAVSQNHLTVVRLVQASKDSESDGVEPGDVVTHCYNRHTLGIMDQNGKIKPGVHEPELQFLSGSQGPAPCKAGLRRT